MSVQQALGIDIVTQATPLGGGGNANAQAIFAADFATPLVSISFPFGTEVAWTTGIVVQNLDALSGASLMVVYDPTGIVGGPYDVFPIYLTPRGTPGSVESIQLAPPYLGAFDAGVGFGVQFVAPGATASVQGLALGYYFPAS